MVGMRQNIPSLRGTALSRGLSPRSLASSLWNWHVDSVEGEQVGEEFVFVSTGLHKVYTVLAHPVEPWKRANGDPQSAWTLALDRACEWAKGATTENAALAAVTRNLFYSCGFVYNEGGKLPTYFDEGYFSASFKLRQYLAKSEGDLVNCVDQAYAVHLLGSLLGADASVKKIEPFGCLDTTTTPVVGLASGRVFAFGSHYFVISGGKVFDGCCGPTLGDVGIGEYVTRNVNQALSLDNRNHPVLQKYDVPYGTVGNVGDAEKGMYNFE